MTDDEKVRLVTQGGLVALVLFVVVAVGVTAYLLSRGPQGGSVIDNALKVATIIGAISFFAYKAASGSFANSTSMTLTVTAHQIGDETWGAATLALERGENLAVDIREIYVRVQETGVTKQVPFKEPGREHYYLTPKEHAQYGVWIPLKTGERATVTAVAVVQQQYFSVVPASHVYASTVVLPDVSK
ncbi:hypothetical protein [Caballeronia grimmiae]|uniref:hypothetical protein n=1 Tax=Caballeronia grimmiae TaxID=1071679 RepID=UPI0038B83087